MLILFFLFYRKETAIQESNVYTVFIWGHTTGKGWSLELIVGVSDNRVLFFRCFLFVCFWFNHITGPLKVDQVYTGKSTRDPRMLLTKQLWPVHLTNLVLCCPIHTSWNWEALWTQGETLGSVSPLSCVRTKNQTLTPNLNGSTFL